MHVIQETNQWMFIISIDIILYYILLNIVNLSIFFNFLIVNMKLWSKEHLYIGHPDVWRNQILDVVTRR